MVASSPVSENVKWFSGRSAVAAKETTRLDLASMGLYSSDSAIPGEDYCSSGRGGNRKCLGVKLQAECLVLLPKGDGL